MQLNELVTLGEIFELKVGEDTVRTKLQEIVSDSEFLVMQPTIKGVPVHAEEQDVSFTFYRQNGCYSFRARISAPFRREDISLCRIERISEIKRIQRRQCYRLPIMLDVLLYETQEEGGQPSKRWRGKTINLSEKSVALSGFICFEDGTQLTIEIRLSQTETITLQAKVLRSKRPLRPTDPFEMVLIYIDHEEKDRAYLRRFIFRQQALMRRKDIDSE